MTQVDKLKVLDEVWSKSKEARLLPCRIDDAAGTRHAGGIVLNNLQYSRGTASVSVEHLALEPGIYAGERVEAINHMSLNYSSKRHRASRDSYWSQRLRQVDTVQIAHGVQIE